MSVKTPDNRSPFPLVVAVKGNRGFEFRCPACRERLRLPDVAYDDLVECAACDAQFHIATKKQIRKVRRFLGQQAKALKKRIKQLRASAEVPPHRISVFGVSSSGKSVYLASLYHELWTAMGSSLSAKAQFGGDHEYLINDYNLLESGQWLDATTRTRPFDLSLRFDGTKATLTSLDYPGEVFTDVFYRNRIDGRDQQQLYDQLRTTMAALILVDPDQVAGDEDDARRDVEFTAVEIAERLNLQGLGGNLAIVLTKRNQNKVLVESHGGAEAFVEERMPRLHEAASTAPVFHISAIGTRITDEFLRVPTCEAYDGTQVLLPLQALLKRIDPAYLALLQTLDLESMAAARDAEESEKKAGIEGQA